MTRNNDRDPGVVGRGIPLWVPWITYAIVQPFDCPTFDYPIMVDGKYERTIGI
ncbi:hypothetical protein U2F10_06310 [Leptothoe sp. EHU-05/26/07-4]